MSKYFVTVHVTVQERKEKEELNTPGGDALGKRLGGPASLSLPFFAFVDSAGATIVNSIEPARGANKGGNIGHPAEPHEIDWFMEMVGKAAPRMTVEERGAIEKWLRAQKK